MENDAKPTSFFVEEVAEAINETPENATEINEDTTPDFRRVMKDLLRWTLRKILVLIRSS